MRPQSVRWQSIRWIEARDPEPSRMDWVSAKLAAGVGLMVGALMGLAFVVGRASGAEAAAAAGDGEPARLRIVRAHPPPWTETYVDGMLATQPAPPPQTWRAPYSHAAASGMLRMPKQLAFPPIGVMLLGYCAKADVE